MKAGIAIDTWKLNIFDHHLRAAGFTYTHRAFNQTALFLTIRTNNLDLLRAVAKAAEAEAKLTGKPL